MRCRLMRPLEDSLGNNAACETAAEESSWSGGGSLSYKHVPYGIRQDTTGAIPTGPEHYYYNCCCSGLPPKYAGTLVSVLLPGRRPGCRCSGPSADVANEHNVRKVRDAVRASLPRVVLSDRPPTASETADTTTTVVMSGDGDCGSLHGLRGKATREVSAMFYLRNPVKYEKQSAPLVPEATPREGTERRAARATENATVRDHCTGDDDATVRDHSSGDDGGARPADRRTGERMDVLASVPIELAIRVVLHLSPSDLASLSIACRPLAAITRHFRTSDGQVMPVRPSQHALPELQALATSLDTTNFPTLVKNSRPGLGVFIAAEPANVCNTLFELRLERLAGINLDVGLAPVSAFAGGGLQRNRAWLFDCWGRKSHCGISSAYGAKLQSGDRLGMLFNYAAKSLTFLLNGMSMGTAFSDLSCQQPLFPVISMPFLPGEAVTLLQPPHATCDLSPLEASHAHWTCPPHPDDEKLIVETMWYSSFRLQLDLTTLTVRRLKRAIAGLMRCDQESLCIMVDGSQCPDYKHLAEDCHVRFGSNHTHLPHVLLSLAHAVS